LAEPTITAQQASKLIAGQKRIEEKLDVLIAALAEEEEEAEEPELQSLDGERFGRTRNPLESL
jgi:hypothetical protein